MKLMKWKLLLVAVAGFAFADDANAQATQNISVSATVPNFCIFDGTSETAMAFDLSNVATAVSDFDATTTLRWRCSNGFNTSIEIDGGTTTGNVDNRAMSSGTDTLNYNLFTDNTYSQIWGDDTGASARVAIAGTGMGNVTDSVVYGRVLLADGQAAEPGAYTDTVVVTILP
ncbi:MAG: spore coat U domain-containing protein [Woeseiaceae bacterium]|nr:spore coat U domain-containing protein [Woeseiaceae bacterium]